MKVNTPKRRFKGFSEDWEQRKLKDITEMISERNTDNHYQNVFTNSALHGIINQTDYFDRNIANSTNLTSYYVVHKNNFIYNPRISSNAPYGPINRNKLNQVGIMSPLYLVFENRLASHDFLEYYFFSSKWYKYMLKVGNTGARSDRYAVKNKDFFNMPIFIPEYDEQCKIGNILKVLNKTISLHKRKLEKIKQLQQSYLKESILSKPKCVPKRRFKCFINDWEQEKLKNVVERVTRKNNGKTDLPLTISAQNGLVDQRHYFNKQVASKNMDNYILIKKGEYAYNKSYSKDYPFGAIKMLKKYDYGALSTLYIVFKPTNISPRFLEAYYESHYWHKEINKIAAEGARNHGLLNLSTQDFFKTNIKIPSTLEEQLKISDLVNQLDILITLHKRKHKAIKKLQKIYLQNNLKDETYA